MVQPAVRSNASHVLDTLIEWGASLLYGLSVLFVFGLAIRATAYLGDHLVNAETYSGILTLLDPVMFLMMLAELLHTLALTIRTHHLPLRPLLALIFMALVRHAVVLASTASLATMGAAATALGIVLLTVLLIKIPSHDAD